MEKYRNGNSYPNSYLKTYHNTEWTKPGIIWVFCPFGLFIFHWIYFETKGAYSPDLG